MRNLKIPWPQPLPDDRTDFQWREEILELFLDAVEAKIPAVFKQNTPKVVLFFFNFINMYLECQKTCSTPK